MIDRWIDIDMYGYVDYCVCVCFLGLSTEEA